MALPLQWSLDRTVDRGLDVAIDFARIAHHDHVQPIALMACEKFGNTLPICRQTRALIENGSHRDKESLILKSIAALIIPAGGQALERLASNVAGLNFLALATALVSVMTVAHSASAIQKMVEDTASDKQLVPPELHVRHLLEVFEPRLNRIGFLDRCYATERFLRDILHGYQGNGNDVPTSLGIGAVVSALRNLARLGDEEIDHVVLTPHSCLAWLITFVEWCLGVPLAIYSTDGSTIVVQPESRVIFRIPASLKPSEGVKIETFTSSNKLYDYVHIQHLEDDYGRPLTFSGMVSLKTHLEQYLQSIDADSGLGTRAVMETLSYALGESLNTIVPYRYETPPAESLTMLARCFPTRNYIEEVATAYLGSYAKDFRGVRQLPPGSNRKLILGLI